MKTVEEPALLVGDVAQPECPLRSGEPSSRIRGPERQLLDRSVIRRPSILLLLWMLHAVCSKSVLPYVATGNNVHTRAVRLQLILFSKTFGAF